MPIHGIDKEKNPLTFVDRLLDEERESNMHLGDIRFWRHMEYIDCKQIYRRKSIEYRNMKLMFCEALFFFLFVVAETLFITECRPSFLYEARSQQLDYWGGCTHGKMCRYHEVEDIHELMDWIIDDLIPKVFTERTRYPTIAQSRSVYRLQQGTTDWTPRYAGDTLTSILLGSVRIRQLRVQYNKDCVIKDEWKGVHPDCFPAFSSAVQSRYPWAPEWTPERIKPYFAYQTANYTEMTPVSGVHGTYPADGYFFDIPLNLTGAQERMRELRSWKWLDRRTRAVVVELSTLNPNVNAFVHNRMLFEVPAMGGVVKKHEVFAFPLNRLSISLMLSDNLLLLLFSYVVLVGFHFAFLLYVIWLIKQNGMPYFTYVWSLVDVALLVLFFADGIVNVNVFFEQASIPNLSPEVIADPEMFVPIGRIVPYLEWDAFLLAVHALLTWVKILKYLNLIQSFQGFVRVLEACLRNVTLFAGLMVTVLFGFAAAFYRGYGGDNDIFTSLLGSFIVCVIAPAGGVSLDRIFAAGDAMGPILYIAYFLLVFLLLLNVFLAICVDTYTVCMFELQEVYKVTKQSPSRVFLWTYANALLGKKLVGKETEEDIGNPDEQTISLNNLPEAIVDRYMNCKRHMEKLVRDANSEIEEAHRAKMLAAGVLDDDEIEEELKKKAKRRQSNLPMLEDVSTESLGFQTRAEKLEAELANTVVKRVQLQRMLDDDEVLREICGADRAIDVMRQFRVDHAGIDPYEAVAKLQANVAKLLKDLDGGILTFDELETLKAVSQELHNALIEAQKEWREELLSVLQMATLLSRALMELTGLMEKVTMGHKKMSTQTGPPR